MYLTAVGAVLLLNGLLFCGTAVTAWYRIRSPAVNLFALVAATAGLGATILSAGVLIERPVIVLFVAITVGLFLSIPWALFSFDYVGQESLVSPWVGAAISIPSVVGFVSTVVIFGERLVPRLALPSQENGALLRTIFTNVLDLSQFFGLLYSGGVMLVGTGLILWTFQRYLHLDSTTGIVLGTFGTIPWMSVFFGLQLQPVSFIAFVTTIAIGFSLGSLSGVALVGPYPLFDRVPAAGNVGPKTIIEELEEMVVVTDGDGTVVELNAAAEQPVDSVETAVGQSVESLFGESLEELEEKQMLELQSESGRTLLEPSLSEVTDQHGQPLGYAIVLRDVTIRMTRQQRLDVFNRILRHNLRNNMTVIVGRAEMIRNRTKDETVAETADLIVEKGDELVDISQSVRDADGVLNFEAKAQQHTPLEPVIRTVLESIASQYEGEFHYEGPDDIVVPVTEEAIKMAVRELVENAIKHNDSERPVVTAEVRYSPEESYPVRLSVMDNGPGIPEAERQVIESGGETSLEHASGVGLWIIRWISASVGGELSISDGDPRGSTVSLSLPSADRIERGEATDRESAGGRRDSPSSP